MSRIIYWAGVVVLLIGVSSCGSSRSATNKVVPSAKSKNQQLSGAQVIRLKRNFLEANREKILGNFDQAELLFEQCLQIDPNHGAASYEIALLQQGEGRYETSLGYVQKAVASDPSNQWYQVLLGRTFDQLKKHKESAKVFSSLAKDHPFKLEYYYEWANSLIYAERYGDAIEVYDQIQAVSGISEDLSVQKQKLHLRNGDWDKAVAEIKTLIEAFPREPKHLAQLADLYQQKGKTKEALEVFEQMLKLDPDNPFVLLSMADYYKAEGEDGKAFESLKKAFSNPEMDIDSKVQILLNYYAATERNPNKELKKEAFELTEVLVKTHPNEAKASSIYGDFLLRDRRFEEARSQFRDAIANDNGKFILWSQLLVIESELNDIESMLKESKEAMELFPSQPSFYFFNGAAHIQQKNYDEAITALEEGVELVFDNPQLLAQFHASLGDAYYNKEDYINSDKNYDRSLEIQPGNLYVLNNYSYFLSLRGEKLDQAERMSKECVDKQPTSSSYLDTYAWVLYKREKFEDAKYYIELALNHGGNKSDVILEHFGDILFKLDDKEGAMLYWKKAAEAGKGSEFLQQKISTGELHE